jgi:hypothetical protein
MSLSARIARVPLAVKQNVAANPTDVRFLGAETIVAQAHQLPDLIQQFRLARFARPR